MSKNKIFIVDDDKHITLYVKTILEKSGLYEVYEENVGTCAVASAEKISPDLIFLDVLMPGVEGGVIAAKLKGHPRLKNVPVVFLTGTVTEEKSGMIGGVPFLAKPVSPEQLLSCAARYLKEKK